jgi:phosphate-selective porin OprO/OprP
LRVGQFKEPMGLEELTSIGYSTFLERGAPDRLLPARNIGVMAYDYCHQTKRMNWAVGLFRDDTPNDTGQNARDGQWAGTARVSGTPMMTDDTHLVHVGGSYSMRALRGDNYLVSFKGESAITQNTIADVTVAADHAQIAGFEAAWERGPLTVQSEYVVSMVDRTNDTQVDFNGFYIYGSWFLTGEHRPYKSETGTFQRVNVKKPIGGKEGGNGAFEFALRYSNLNLDSEANPGVGQDGGNVDSVTAGFNWYFNNYVRLMVNLTHENAGGDAAPIGSSSANIFAIRLALDV